MLKKAASKVAWMARATTTVVGVAIMAALIFGATSAAFAGSGVGGVFNLGRTNTVDQQSALVGDTASPNLRIFNQGNAPGLSLRVGDQGTPPAQKTVAPMKVDSQGKVRNLNADEVDGNSAGAFLGSNVVVRTDEVDLNNGDTSTSNTALCQDGEVATGGGGSIVLDGAGEGTPPVNGEFVIAASRPALVNGPDAPPAGWQFSIFDRDADASNNGLFTLRVYAVCTNVGAEVTPPPPVQ